MPKLLDDEISRVQKTIADLQEKLRQEATPTHLTEDQIARIKSAATTPEEMERLSNRILSGYKRHVLQKLLGRSTKVAASSTIKNKRKAERRAR
jgi:hypothetical protein